MSDKYSIFGSLIYRAIGEPEYWQQNSVEALLQLLTDEFSLNELNSLAQIKLGKELVGKLGENFGEKEFLASAVMTVLDDARYGLFLVDQKFNVVYYNKKVKIHLHHLLDENDSSLVSEQLRNVISHRVTSAENIQHDELVRLDYQCDTHAHVYHRSIEQDGSDVAKPQYLHQIVVANAGDSSNQICEQVSKRYGLSDREISIVQSAVRVLAVGGSTKEIAEDLFISPNTVKSHLKSIYSKSDVNSLAALVSLYLQHEIQQLASYFGGGSSLETTLTLNVDKTLELSCGQIICYREYGDEQGDPLVVLHNNYSSRLNIPPNGDAIASKLGRRIIIPDRPGYGKSLPNEQYPEKWCQQLAEIVEHLQLENFDLLGNTLSVRYALEFVMLQPDKVNKLILASPLLHTFNQDQQYFGEWLAASVQLYEYNSEVATEIYKLWHSSAALRLNDHIEKNLTQTISSREKGLMDSDDFLQVLKNNFRESSAQQGKGSAEDFRYCFNKTNLDLSLISVPVEIWVGSEDSLVSPQGVRETFKTMPNITIYEEDGYGEHIYYSLFERIIVSKAT